MQQFKTILKRLKKPSVILSIVSQIVTILLLLNVKVDTNIVAGVATAICSIFVLLGIMDNPETERKGYGDDILICSHCGKEVSHYKINNQLYCSECGNQYDGT